MAATTAILAATEATAQAAPVRSRAIVIAAQLIGRPADALHFYTSVDSAALNSDGTFDYDWIIFARSIKGRGDAALALGDTAAARRHYERFVRLWKNADPQFRPEREVAIHALASLSRGDRPQVRIIPR